MFIGRDSGASRKWSRSIQQGFRSTRESLLRNFNDDWVEINGIFKKKELIVFCVSDLKIYGTFKFIIFYFLDFDRTLNYRGLHLDSYLHRLLFIPKI